VSSFLTAHQHIKGQHNLNAKSLDHKIDHVRIVDNAQEVNRTETIYCEKQLIINTTVCYHEFFKQT